MQQFTVHRIGPEIKIAGVDLSFTNASLFMVISATVVILFLFLGSKEKKIIPSKLQLMAEMATKILWNEGIIFCIHNARIAIIDNVSLFPFNEI